MANIINFENVMKGVLAMPGVRVDRTAFLLSTFRPYGDAGDAVELVDKKPSQVYSKEVLDKVAQKVMINHTLKVTALSTAAGIPGGLAMAGTVPADLAQYYWNFLVMAQKLAYIYGWPDLSDENNNLGEGAQGILTMFIGIGMGVEGAQNGLAIIARKAAEHWARKLPRMALTKTGWYPILRKVLSYIGVKITRESVGKSAGKIIPFIGAVLSGGMTYVTFKPMAKKLRRELASTALMAEEKEKKEE